MSRNAHDRPRTLLLPPLPYAAAIAGGWWLDRNLAALHLDLGAVTRPLAWLVFAAALVLMGWAVQSLLRHRTTVSPYSGAKELCVSGPFRLSRNPIYLADWLLLAGFSLWFATWWPLLFAPLVWLLVRFGVIRHEEAHLAARFGERYAEYCSRVRRWL